MKLDIVIAGVGGQGILTIARILSLCAAERGLNVKQAEVHGMSQRGGAVYSHLRISDDEIFSDLIPQGAADMILAVEPLEALRYFPMLKLGGVVIASTDAEVNIPDYPPIETVLFHVAAFANHVALDMDKLARAAGGILSANVAALGAASIYLPFSLREMEEAIQELFCSKGERVVATNVRALRFGRTAAAGYREALAREVDPQTARAWIANLPAEHLASEDDLDFCSLAAQPESTRLTGAEAHAFESLLMGAYHEDRRPLYEHEVYRLLELVGGISPPRHLFVPKGSTVSEETLARFPGEKVVLKLVSAEVVHKTGAGAVLILPKLLERVRTESDRMIARFQSAAGVLLVEFVEHGAGALGHELFVGIRATREFGPVIAAGLGGVETEYLASKMKPGVAVAKAAVSEVDSPQFLELFKQTAAYDVLAGRIRGQERIVSDSELLRCFRAFISIAREFCVDRGEAGPDINELEVNPFAFSNQRLIPLDGRGSLHPAAKEAAPRPLAGVHAMLEPKKIALIGVSSKDAGFGRVILRNMLKSGFPAEGLAVVKPKTDSIEGVKCVPKIEDLPEPVDLLVVSIPAFEVPETLEACNRSGKVRSAIIISGGAGETKGSEAIGEAIECAILRGRSGAGGGAVFLGPNCMGVRSLPGKYDTFFIPEAKLPLRAASLPQPLALISQSGAFVVSRLSSQTHLNPRFAISIGNQCDITVSDLLQSMDEREDIRVVGVYLEGFKDLDGIAAARSVAGMTAKGKKVVFYKAGRTASGRYAAAGHTAALAGDYDICLSALSEAGAQVVGSFREFNQALELALCTLDRPCGERRVFAIANAGMEAVAMADAGLRLDPLTPEFSAQIQETLTSHGLSGLVSPRNPLDLTPEADESAYDEIVRAAQARPEIDALIVCCLPLTPTQHTLSGELEDPHSFPNLARGWIAESKKPVLFVVDAGPEYDELVRRMRAAGVPVFPAADEAARSLLNQAC